MRVQHFEQLPKPYLAYPKVIQGLVQQQIDQHIHKKIKPDAVLPDVEYIVDFLQIDMNHLKKYKDICYWHHDDYVVPAMYLSVLAQSLQMHMMTNEDFPFALLGLVHIRNQITQHRVIYATETFELSCRFGDLRPHEKGLQFDFIITAKVADEIVFEGITTYLSRQKRPASEKTMTNNGETTTHYQFKTSFQADEDLGRRYALISGDFNFIHLHAIPAKLFGFQKAIAHGMWSKARTLATLGSLPDAYQADVQFKLPMFLPSNVSVMTAQHEDSVRFLLQNTNNQKPHLVGTLTKLSH